MRLGLREGAGAENRLIPYKRHNILGGKLKEGKVGREMGKKKKQWGDVKKGELGLFRQRKWILCLKDI